MYFGRIAFLVGSYCTVKENFLNVASVNPEFGKTLAQCLNQSRVSADSCVTVEPTVTTIIALGLS